MAISGALGAAGIAAGASILGGYLSGKSQEKLAGKNRQLQKQFAKEGIRWKVEDARAAGIHPLYALGASTPAFTPDIQSGSGLGEGIAQAGQSIQRGMQAAEQQRASQPAQAAALAHTQAQTDYIGWQTQLLKNKVMEQKLNQTGIGRDQVTAQHLDMSQVTDPATGRVAMVNTPVGWHRLDTSQVPQRVMEDEYGEIAEVYGAGRYLQDYGGIGPSFREIRNYFNR